MKVQNYEIQSDFACQFSPIQIYPPMKFKQGFPIFYIFLALIEILSEYFELTFLVYFTKPLLVLSLIYFVISSKISVAPSQKKLFVIALLFAVSGDVFLMIRHQDYFIPGLASFLVMQWLYILVFRKQIYSTLFSSRSLLLLLPFLFYAGFLIWLISPNLTDPIIRVAVAIYALSIAAMSWMAGLRQDSVSRRSFIYVLAGALLFMISDSLIAISRFLNPIPLQAIWVMGTYAAAQFLITIGVTKN